MNDNDSRQPILPGGGVMHLQKKLAFSGILILSQILSIAPAIAEEFNTATLVEARGDVFKRGFIDWNREQWEDPSPAKKGDRLQEGMQLGTGDKSWAQLSWRNVTARAWANSIYAVAPNQRLVYLLGGEMLYHLDKHRKDKSPYYVWTKLVQARVRGTTILFQNTENSTRVTVLEGCVDVLNRTDRSVVRITPGVVYEVKDLSAGSKAGANSGALGAVSTNVASTVSNVALAAKPVTLFQTQKTVTSIYALNPTSALSHPLLTGFQSPLSSLPLVQNTLTPLISKVDSLIGGLLNGEKLNGAQILSVPRSIAYEIGPLAGTAFNVPREALGFFPPSGIIGSKPPELNDVVAPFVQPRLLSRLMPSSSLIAKSSSDIKGKGSILPTELIGSIGSSSSGKTLIGSVSDTEKIPLQILPDGTVVNPNQNNILNLNALSKASGNALNFLPIGGSALLPNGGNANFGNIGSVGMLSTFVGSAGGSSVYSAAGSATTSGGLAGTIGGVTGAVGGTVGGLIGGGTSGGSGGGLLGGVGGVGGVGGALGGLGGGLGGGGGGLLGGGGGGLFGH
ncbi:MAG: FecR domain-containing protein [Candidatus Obscuribacterales bacterium]|nr:FecR domain-containing protein [Candidatus Obscuribacterales bacterium]